MQLILTRPTFELYVDCTVHNGLVSISFQSRWPQARTDRSLHELLQLNVTEEEAVKLADAIKDV